ncbi:MAG: leucyl aminopeptidase [Sedimentisphaerales bacterium]|jgi:leucyl aminopeptidase
MKRIIEVELKTRPAALAECKTQMLAIGHFSDGKKPLPEIIELCKKLGGAIEQVVKLGDFKGKTGTSALIYGNNRIGAQRVLIVGLGEQKKATIDTIRQAAALAANKAVSMKAKSLALAIHKPFGAIFDPGLLAQAMAEGIYYGSFRYDEYITSDEDGRTDSLVVEVIDDNAAKMKRLEEGLLKGAIIGKAQSYARALANRPGNVINPPSLAAEAKKLAKNTKGLSCKVLDEKQLAKLGMGGILAVGSGSKTPPRLIIVKYAPKGKANKLPTVALVGKAITFDSGGISIKPAQNMEQMKLDKTGGIAVLAAAKAAAELKLPVNLMAIVPSAENMPSGTSYRPGDIVTTYSGKTVEIQNTDAEGRMILCDALHYAVKQNCDVIIDVATLTGACVVALGTFMAGLMGNDEQLNKNLEEAAKNSGEKVWQLPCGDEYADEMKSKIADLKNSGGRWGGACTAAAFLRQFVGDKKWAHLDIAGVDCLEKPTASAAEGASAFGVRLLTTYLMNLTSGKKGK